MFFRRSPHVDVAPAHRALAEGRYEAAVALLEGATRRQRRRSAQAQLKLYLAAAYALYGPDGLEGGLSSLREAAEADGEVARGPLYRALYWEFAAYRGDAASDVRKGALGAAEAGDPFATYHAACALFAIRAFRRATKLLKSFDPQRLPGYLLWRYWSLLGRSYDASGLLENAADAFERAVALCPAEEEHPERLNLASCLLELHRASDALRVLAEVDEDLLDGDEERAFYIYLEGRAHLLLGNPNLALEHLQRADVLEDAAGSPSYALKLALAQCYGTLGNYAQAIAGYLRAIELAPKRQRTWAIHECALLLLEADRLVSAKELLLEALRAEGYAYRAEVYADLAEVEFKLGNLHEADEFARRALDLGAVVSACLTLGSVAYEYYHLDEAVTWFEKAASASHQGSADWLHAQEMLADIFVQQGYRQPERIIRHAQAALKHLHPTEEWARILRGYVGRAKELLGGHSRHLN